MRSLLRRLRVLFNRGRFESELEEEMRYRLDRKAAEGGSADDAGRKFGSVTLLKEESRDMWTWTFCEQLGQDIRYAFRSMAGSKLFTAMAVLSLALGIGANTAIYSFMDAVMIRALAVKHPALLFCLNQGDTAGRPFLDN